MFRVDTLLLCAFVLLVFFFFIVAEEDLLLSAADEGMAAGELIMEVKEDWREFVPCFFFLVFADDLFFDIAGTPTSAGAGAPSLASVDAPTFDLALEITLEVVVSSMALLEPRGIGNRGKLNLSTWRLYFFLSTHLGIVFD